MTHRSPFQHPPFRESVKTTQVTAQRRFKIMKWMGNYNGAENSRIADAQETAEEGQS